MGRPFGRDADNLPVARLRALLRVLPAGDVDLVVAGSPRAVAAVRWPERAKVTTSGLAAGRRGAGARLPARP